MIGISARARPAAPELARAAETARTPTSTVMPAAYATYDRTPAQNESLRKVENVTARNGPIVHDSDATA